MIESESEMRHGPGRDPRLNPAIEHWHVRTETDWPFGGMMTMPAQPPWTVAVAVKFSNRDAARRFEKAVMELLRDG